MKNIVNFSGGKDSAAMLLMMLEKGIPVDDIIFVNIMATKNIGAELPKTYQYIRMIEKYIGRKITRLRPKNTYEEAFYRVKKKGKHVGDIYGFPYLKGAWCNSELKMEAINRYNRKQTEEFTQYIGIAADEPKRLARLKPNCKAPLAEWGITEARARQYLADRGLLSSLYERYDRLGCWFCNKASLKSLRILYHDNPQYWNMLKDWEKDSWQTFKPDKTLMDLEERFKQEDRQLRLF